MCGEGSSPGSSYGGKVSGMDPGRHAGARGATAEFYVIMDCTMGIYYTDHEDIERCLMKEGIAATYDGMTISL